MNRRAEFTGEVRRLFLFASLLLSLPFASVAQRNWSVVAQVVPLAERTNYPRRTFYPNSDGQVVEPIYISGVRWATGFQAGGVVQYGFAPGWSVGAGVAYRQFTTRQERPGNDGTTTILSRAIRVPVLLNFQLAKRRLSPCFMAGTLLDFPMPSRVTVRRDGQPTQQLTLDTEHGPVFYLTAGAGFRYRFSQDCALTAQPTISYKAGRFGDGRSHNSTVEVGLQLQIVHSF